MSSNEASGEEKSDCVSCSVEVPTSLSSTVASQVPSSLPDSTAPTDLPPSIPSYDFPAPLHTSNSSSNTTPSLIIEFCDRCRWLHRASWVQTELLITFSPPPATTSTSTPAPAPAPAPSKASGGAVLRSSTLIPMTRDETAGRFRVWIITSHNQTICISDRKSEGGFPEVKVLKQRIRDLIAPYHSLGHSDRGGKKDSSSNTDA
ncbi:Thioredoxin-like fold [Ceraceosorus bombacis]|uniref:Thioredoxin-like fold n=1 Tax=Ceraceosorus bombacis TaxID=401625 RepID=A0A0P1BCC4_9BASI|nr:Thioredoxin-like fold [Ceraceosorus bombacis]